MIERGQVLEKPVRIIADGLWIAAVMTDEFAKDTEGIQVTDACVRRGQAVEAPKMWQGKDPGKKSVKAAGALRQLGIEKMDSLPIVQQVHKLKPRMVENGSHFQKSRPDLLDPVEENSLVILPLLLRIGQPAVHESGSLGIRFEVQPLDAMEKQVFLVPAFCRARDCLDGVPRAIFHQFAKGSARQPVLHFAVKGIIGGSEGVVLAIGRACDLAMAPLGAFHTFNQPAQGRTVPLLLVLCRIY